MRAEIARQATDGLPDTSFCASDVAFHRALVDAAGNPILAAGTVRPEAVDQLTEAAEALADYLREHCRQPRPEDRFVEPGRGRRA